MKVVLLILIILHGLIHLLGFAKAFNLAGVNQLTRDVSKAHGIMWLASTALFVTAAVLFFYKKDSWWILMTVAVFSSQYLIFMNWHDTRIGTMANFIIVFLTIIGYGTWRFNNAYEAQVKIGLQQRSTVPDSILTDADMQHLPEVIKKYIWYTGAVGRSKVENFKVKFTGQIRKDEQSEWMSFTSEQFNFMNAPTRLFFMKATMKHFPVAGFHSFKNESAFMDIRLLSLFKVQYQSGIEMRISETVTFFNDMCCMAPATLIDKRIKWVYADSHKAKAEFSNNGIIISAWLYFNDKGELINFVSDDRYAATENNRMKKLRWSTPIKDYREFDGYKLPGYAEAIYSYPEEDLCYGKFRLINIEYNCKAIQ